jgi:hypothetical protein
MKIVDEMVASSLRSNVQRDRAYQLARMHGTPENEHPRVSSVSGRNRRRAEARTRGTQPGTREPAFPTVVGRADAVARAAGAPRTPGEDLDLGAVGEREPRRVPDLVEQRDAARGGIRTVHEDATPDRQDRGALV